VIKFFTAKTQISKKPKRKFPKMFKTTILGIVSFFENDINLYIQSPIGINKKCSNSLLSDLDIGKCFNIKSTGTINFYRNWTTALCYTGCYTFNKWKMKTPKEHCMYMCDRDLFNYTIVVNKMEGFKSIKFDDITLIDAKFDGDYMTIETVIDVKTDDKIKLESYIEYSGPLVLPSKTTGNIYLKNVKGRVNANFKFLCNMKRIKLNDIYINNLDLNADGDLSFFFDDWTFINDITLQGSKIINYVSGGINEMINKITDKVLEPILLEAFQNVSNRIIKRKIELNIPCKLIKNLLLN